MLLYDTYKYIYIYNYIYIYYSWVYKPAMTNLPRGPHLVVLLINQFGQRLGAAGLLNQCEQFMDSNIVVFFKVQPEQ